MILRCMDHIVSHVMDNVNHFCQTSQSGADKGVPCVCMAFFSCEMARDCGTKQPVVEQWHTPLRAVEMTWRPPSNASASGKVGRWQTSADGLSLGSRRRQHYRLRGGQGGVDQLLGGGQRAPQRLGNFRRQLGVHISPELPQTGMNNTLYLCQ